jgi:DNA-directed RNA polymerase specialized sigma24 family protein
LGAEILEATIYWDGEAARVPVCDAGGGPASILDRFGRRPLYGWYVVRGMAEPEIEGHSLSGAPTIRDPEGVRLVAECLAGDRAARVRFQERFGPFLYRFARCMGGPPVEPGDFYVFLFEDDRLYRRLRTFEGRAHLEPYLQGFVLPDLLKRFHAVRKKEALDTISLDTDCVQEPADPSGEQGAQPPGERRHVDLFGQLSPEKRVLIKLLYVEDFDLGPDEIQFVARCSGRSVRAAVELVERARRSVRERETTRRATLAEAESAAQWILQYGRRQAEITDALNNLPPNSTRAARLRSEHTELQRKRSWREQQRDRARTAGERATVTLRYREIAHILNAPTGSISTQVMRLRHELSKLVAQATPEVKVP